MKYKKALLPISLLAVVSTLASCGKLGPATSSTSGGNYQYNVDGPNKTKITVGNFGGGIGSLWIEKAADRFAKEVMNKSYADGHQGVYIKFINSFELKTSTMDQSNTSMFFDERFSDITELGQAGLLLDLDEIVLDETRKGGSLDSNIFDSVKDGLKVQGKYYGLPHYEYYGGLTYNHEIFDSIFAYFADPTADDKIEWECKYGTDYFVSDLNTKRSVGPDGKAGTMDDGLPATMEQFIILMDYIKSNNCAPIVISGQYQKYGDYLLSGIWSSLAGTEQMKNYYNCTGEIEVVERDASGNIVYEGNAFPGIDYVKKPKTKKVTMAADGSQGYLGNDMAAKYYAIALLDIMKNEGFFNLDSSISTKSHYDAQKCLYLGDVSRDYDKAAMLIEGSYWYNESSEMGCFNQFEKYTGRKRGDLDVRWMNLPTEVFNSDSFEGKEQCLVDIGHSFSMINGNIKNNPEIKDVCIDFMKFLYSEEELAAFSIQTGMPRMINYPMNTDDLSNSGPFYEKLFKQRNANTDNIIGLSGTTKVFKKAKSIIKLCLQSSPFVDVAGKYELQKLKGGEHAPTIFDDFSIKPSSWKYNND
ncbi:MAG: extracellular solute-binding protein [Bacilli bacterium]|nr:extracellular solute-binding protein [Bacilli bacterium]